MLINIHIELNTRNKKLQHIFAQYTKVSFLNGWVRKKRKGKKKKHIFINNTTTRKYKLLTPFLVIKIIRYLFYFVDINRQVFCYIIVYLSNYKKRKRNEFMEENVSNSLIA